MTKKIACTFCQTTNLVWSKVKGKWRLYDEQGNPHFCGLDEKTKKPAVIKVNDVDRLAELVATLTLRIDALEKSLAEKKIIPEQTSMFEVGPTIPKKKRKIK